MALDDALHAGVRDGGPPVLRLYRWFPACLSFGRNQVAAGVYDPDRIQAAGLHVVRRPTGGLAVLHHHELTYSVSVPAGDLGGARSAYRRINAALVAGLNEFGVAAVLADDAHRAPSPSDRHPCFQAPAAGEVTAGGGKLVGSAQRCERHTLLQHGSILLDGDQGAISALRFEPDHHATAGTSLHAILGGPPDLEGLVRAIIFGFESALGTSLAPSAVDDCERARSRSLEATYRSASWTWRR